MNRVVAVLLLLSLPLVVRAQEITHAQLEDFDLIKLLNGIEILGSYRTETYQVRVLALGDLPGSAGYDSGEITHSVYVAVSEYDELPDQAAFRLSSVISPRLERSATEEGRPTLYLSYGPSGNRQTMRLVASMRGLEIGTPMQ